MRVLELFSGTGSVGQAMRRRWPGCEVVSVDISPKFDPDICVDIAEWDYGEVGHFDVVWASPPCTEYARCRQGFRDFDTADRTAKAALDIIAYVMPNAWFLENPASGYLHTRHFMHPFKSYRKKCSYCRYGFKYRKHTNVWTNLDVTLEACSPATPCGFFERNGYHEFTAQKGFSRLTNGRRSAGCPTETLWRVPGALVDALCDAYEARYGPVVV